jgi:hypothetical protein
MPDTMHSLDFDSLVEKYVRLSPAIRYYELRCLVLAFIPLLVLVITILLGAMELIAFTMFISSALDFHVTIRGLNDVLSKHSLGRLIPGSVLEATFLCFMAVLQVYATISFISLKFTVLAYLAICFLLVQGIVWFGENIWFHFHTWQLLAAKPGFNPTTVAAEVLFIGNVWGLGLYFCVIYLVFRSLKSHWTMSREEIEIIREGRAAPIHVSNFLRAFGIPMNIKNSSRRVRTGIYCYLGNLVGLFPPLAFMVIGYFAYPLFILTVGRYFRSDMSQLETSTSFNIFGVIVIIAAVYSLVTVSRVVGNLFIRRSRRFLRVSLEQAQATDRRHPVLFLRSFRDDAVSLPPPKSGFAYKLFNYIERNKSLDQLLLEEGTSIGPVVALGNPKDAVPPYGAARVYFQNDDWQKMISYLMEGASAIVICVDDSESLWWEIEYVSKYRYVSKTLFLLHPKYGSENNAPDIIRDLEKVLGHALQTNVVGRNLIGVWLDGMSGYQVGVASHFSRVHYLLMLRWFLRSKMKATGKFGKAEPDTEPPFAIRPVSGHENATSCATVASLIPSVAK